MDPYRRCGYRVQRAHSVFGEPEQVRAEDDAGRWFYLPAAVFDDLDDEAFAAIAAAKIDALPIADG